MIRRPVKLSLQVSAVKIILGMGQRISLSRIVNVNPLQVVYLKCLVLTSVRVPSDNK